MVTMTVLKLSDTNGTIGTSPPNSIQNTKKKKYVLYTAAEISNEVTIFGNKIW